VLDRHARCDRGIRGRSLLLLPEYTDEACRMLRSSDRHAEGREASAATARSIALPDRAFAQPGLASGTPLEKSSRGQVPGAAISDPKSIACRRASGESRRSMEAEKKRAEWGGRFAPPKLRRWPLARLLRRLVFA